MKYLLVLITAVALNTASAHGQTIRRLLLFAGDSTNADLNLQRDWLAADSSGVVDRHVWIAVFADPKTFRRMYEHHDVVRDAFTLVLIGEGGQEKYRSEKPVPTAELFGILDGMPLAKPADRRNDR